MTFGRVLQRVHVLEAFMLSLGGALLIGQSYAQDQESALFAMSGFPKGKEVNMESGDSHTEETRQPAVMAAVEFTRVGMGHGTRWRLALAQERWG